jgi:hypothetical protein
MKKILLLTVLAALAIAAPSARAFDPDPWHPVQHRLHDLHDRMALVDDQRAHVGAAPWMRDQIARLHHGINDLDYKVHNHVGDPRDARHEADHLIVFMSHVEHEYAEYPHHHVWIRIVD